MWLIIGYGNSLRCDDGAGPSFVTQLRSRLPESAAQFICEHQLLPEMVEQLARPEIDKVLFVDAKRDQHPPFHFTPLCDQASESQSVTHQYGPQWLLSMSAALYQQPRQGWLLSLRAVNLDHGEQLSTDTQNAITLALEATIQFLATPPKN